MYERDLATVIHQRQRSERTGTFFCDMTTAQFLPRTPTDVMLAAVMALNAYSVELMVSSGLSRVYALKSARRTDLVETSLVRENGDVPVVACAACEVMNISSCGQPP